MDGMIQHYFSKRSFIQISPLLHKTGGLPLSLLEQTVSKVLSSLKKQGEKNLFVVYSLGGGMTWH